MTRKPIIVLFLVAAALLSETQISDAQSPYSYPWCSLGGTSMGSNALSCYYTSREQCRTTMFGIAGLCIENPYYHGQAPPPPQRQLAKTRHHRTPGTAGG